jgi:hypothetical protein
MYRKTAAALIIVLFAPIAGAQTMLECAKLESQEDRLACYDEVAGRVEKDLKQTQQGTTQERVEARNEAIAEAVVGQQAEEAVPDLLKLEIQKVIRDSNRRVTYQTTDGRYFQRSTGSKVTFKAGDTCTIEEGVLGATFLVRDDGRKNKVKELSVR